MHSNSEGYASVLQDMEQLINRIGRSVASRSGVPFLGPATPLLNIWENEDALVVTGEVPGVDADSIHISVMGDTLTVSGKRLMSVPQAKEAAGSMEFNRSIQLPYRVDADRTEARTRDGVLTIVLKRPESEKPRKISVKVA
jgi:HSP20 family protein